MILMQIFSTIIKMSYFQMWIDVKDTIMSTSIIQLDTNITANDVDIMVFEAWFLLWCSN